MLEKMSRINRHKEKYGTGNELSMDNSEEGTAARTRPFSFEEIMLGRKKKKLVADAEDRAGEPGKLSGKNNVESVADYSESDGGYKQTLDVKKHVLEDKKTSKKKDEDASRKEDNLLKIKGKEIHNIDANLKVKSNKDSTGRTKSDNSEKRSRHISRNDDRSRGDFENESEKMRLKETMGKDKYVDRDRGKSERAAKRKHQNGDDEESRLEITGNDGKKRDSGKWHDSEYSEKRARKESSQFHYEEMRLKRRSARTREHDRDKDRRSHSVSPRAHRHTFYHAQDYGETSFRSFRDRSARQHSDVDRYRITSNGEHSSSHYRRHGGNSSGLGGYSPRKRRTEAAVKTPSPTPRSPDRKNLGWDLRPAGMDNISSASVLTNFQPPDQTTSSNSQDLPSASLVISNVTKLLSGASQNAISIIKNVPLDSVQLTQATRPMRRLYLENVAASASEKDLMECLNDFLLSMDINHLQVTKPCISCIINKEKGQAVVEFLTPEDATSALSFDGRSFSGSILKIRRPKDFVEPATGAPEKPVASADAMPITDAIPDIINDSPHKIFVGGIPRALSANMFMEIASSFGHLKAYRFQVDKDLNEPVSFLEYVDQSVTLKACAGFSGMKLGGQVLTAVQAFTCASREENGDHTERPQFYGIPEHAKPLLEMPTKVLKLKNVFKPEDLSSLSGLELEETLEDIRLECARFGTIKSVNIVRNNSASEKAAVTVEVDTKGTCQYPEADDGTNKTEMIEGDIDLNSGVNITVEPPVNDKELQEGGNAGNNCTSEDKPAASDSVESKSSEPVQLDGNNKAFVETPCQMDTDGTSQEAPNQLDTVKHQSQYNDKSADVKAVESGPGNDLVVEEELGPDEATSDKFQELSIGLNDDVAMESGNLEEGDKQKASDLDDVFEHGSIFVEYLRADASCMAVHCLHGRLYGDQVVEVGYISHDLYLARFTK